jgi:hypothetical protein
MTNYLSLAFKTTLAQPNRLGQGFPHIVAGKIERYILWLA